MIDLQRPQLSVVRQLRAVKVEPVWRLISAHAGKRREPGLDAPDRSAVSGGVVLRAAGDLPAPRPTIPHPAHRKYPYLLRDLVIDSPNQVWCSDITYFPMRKGFLYLVATMDWATRKVLSWPLSNTMDTNFCVQALHEALICYGAPEIFNTNSQKMVASSRTVCLKH